MIQILWNRVRGSPLKLRPYKFSRVKFGCVAGEEMRVNPAMLFKTLLNEGGPMNLTFIPQKNNRTLKMTQNIVQEPFNLWRFNIFTRMESYIQGGSLSFRRDADSGYRRYLRPIPRHGDMGCLTAWRPGTPDIRDHEKAAFVKKYEMGSSPIRVFLYAAICSVSSAGWPFRRALWLAFRASGSSSRELLESARDDWDDTLYRTFSLSPRQYAFVSIGRYCIQAKEALSAKFVSMFSFGRASAFAGVQVPALASMLPRLLSGTFAARGIPNPANNQVFSLRPTGYNRFSAALWRVGAAFRAAFGFRMVSCI